MPHVSIIGAGTTGLVSALLLRRAGYDVDVYESLPDPRRQGRRGFSSGTVTLSERGLLTFDSIGYRHEIERISLPLSGQQVHPTSGDQFLLPYCPTGNKLWCVSREALDLQLLKLVTATEGIVVCFDANCTAIDTDSRTIYLSRSSGQEEAAVLDIAYEYLIVADGPRSRVRSLLAARQLVTESFTPTEFRFLEFVIPASEMNREIYSPSYLQLWPRKNYFVIGFPLMDGSLVGALFIRQQASEPPRRLSELMTPNQFQGELADLIALVPDLWSRFEQIALRQLTTVAVNPWRIGDHGILLGDAAHVVLPFLGQGMNSSLEDIDQWVSLLEKYKQNWPAASIEFQTTRQPDMASLGRLSRAHFDRLADTVTDTSAHSPLTFERAQHQPGWDGTLTPYQMIEFTRTPYAKCEEYAKEFGERLVNGAVTKKK